MLQVPLTWKLITHTKTKKVNKYESRPQQKTLGSFLALLAEIEHANSLMQPFFFDNGQAIIKSSKENTSLRNQTKGGENMGIRARVLTSRLIESIDANKTYADQIGLSYTLSAAGEKRETEVKVRRVKFNLEE